MSENETVREIVKEIVPGRDWGQIPVATKEPENITEIVFNQRPTEAQLAAAINSVLDAAFESDGVLRLRGARRNC
jgi:hypothetical protein